MKRKKYQLVIAVSIALCSSSPIVMANVPPPPVNQIIGIPDGVFNNMREADCRVCHEGSSAESARQVAQRHHFRVGTVFQTPTDALVTNPGNTYACLSCHEIVINPTTSTEEFQIIRDCFSCHAQSPDEGTVHHKPLVAGADIDCKACHLPIDDPEDGHYIPTSPSAATTPRSGLGLGQNGRGGCAFCHNGGTDTTTRIQVYSNAQTHHHTGLSMSYGYIGTCDVCHELTPGGIPMRKCEKCHGMRSLHAIQVDSNGDGRIVQGEEQPWHGHIGARDDCLGCHGDTVPTAPLPAEIIPPAPELYSISATSIIQNRNTVLTLEGVELASLVENEDGTTTELTSNVVLSKRGGGEFILSPARISDSHLTVSVPSYVDAGSYTARLEKGGQRSNGKNITVAPEIVIASVDCVPEMDAGALTITGMGFGVYYGGMGIDGSGIGVGTDIGPCAIVTWANTEITARCDIGCGIQAEVRTLFGSASAPMGNILETTCASCHGDNSALVNCRNKKWREHLRKTLVNRTIYELAETTLLGNLCSVAGPGNNPKDRARK